jgi:ABC-2 type transport system ATP-binding protein
MSETIVSCESVSKRYGKVRAVQNVTLEVTRGTIFGFIGPSGSGKTTTVRVLTGATVPDSGELRVLGEVPSKFTQATKARIGYMPQNFALYPDLTVRENLSFAAAIYGMGFERRKRLQQVLSFVELEDAIGRPASKLSGGMRRRVSLAATLLHDPEVLFLDEPTTGIDPILRKKFWDHFRELQVEEKTFFVTTQYVSDAAYCDQVAMIVDGEVLVVDSPEGLRRRAFDGDILEVVLAQPWDAEMLSRLENLSCVKRASQVDRRSLHLVVTEAAMALPRLVSWFEKQGVGIESLEEHIPSFDDVFVELAQGHPDVS